MDQLYQYQQRVRDIVLGGRSVILQAPTGAGKTRAALYPFIEAFFDHPSAESFPRKCIYSVPMRVLANQFIAEYEKRADTYRRAHRRHLSTAIQTGERPDDPKFENNLIFATIDQTLSSFLSIPHSLGTPSANLNAGAVISSYLVLDEFHLYDPDFMLPTVLGMLRMLKDVTPFVAMTATFSSNMLQRLAQMLGAVVVPESATDRAEMEQIGSQVGKDRRFFAVDAALTAEAVLSQPAPRVICICNTVRSAQDLYKALREALERQGDATTQVELLHARFYKHTRDAKEQWVREHFSIAQAEYNGPRLILVATQVIEVGVDATCDVMHTEIAPASALLQRAGRCARRQHEVGHVYVYLPRYDDGAPNYTPYVMRNRENKMARALQLCQTTWEALQDPAFSGKQMTFQLEQAFIDHEHTPVDGAILDAIEDTWAKRTEDILRTMASLDSGMTQELIRNINTRFVIIHPEPQRDENLARNPWFYDGFALYPNSLAGVFNQFKDMPVDWVMRGARPVQEQESPAWQNEETPAHQPAEYTWLYRFQNSADAFAFPVLAVHPSLAQYDQEIGFRFEWQEREGELPPIRPNQRRSQSFSYHRETYAEHVRGLYNAYLKPVHEWRDRKEHIHLPLRVEMAYAGLRLECRCGLPTGSLDQMCRALFAIHDLGKLSEGWQDWAHRWQTEVSQFMGYDTRIAPDYMAAHTDYAPTTEQKTAQRKLGPRPNHAAESAISATELLYRVAGDNAALRRAGFTAVARHHSARTDRYQAYRHHPAAPQAMLEALAEVGLPHDLLEHIWWHPDDTEQLADFLVRFGRDHVEEVLLYFWLVRILRITDQRSQSTGNRS